jgi:hypothetical protein
MVVGLILREYNDNDIVNKRQELTTTCKGQENQASTQCQGYLTAGSSGVRTAVVKQRVQKKDKTKKKVLVYYVQWYHLAGFWIIMDKVPKLTGEVLEDEDFEPVKSIIIQ